MGLNFFQRQDVNESVWLSMEKPGQGLALSLGNSQGSDDHPIGRCFLIVFLFLSEIFGWIDGLGERNWWFFRRRFQLCRDKFGFLILDLEPGGNRQRARGEESAGPDGWRRGLNGGLARSPPEAFLFVAVCEIRGRNRSFLREARGWRVATVH